MTVGPLGLLAHCSGARIEGVFVGCRRRDHVQWLGDFQVCFRLSGVNLR